MSSMFTAWSRSTRILSMLRRCEAIRESTSTTSSVTAWAVRAAVSDLAQLLEPFDDLGVAVSRRPQGERRGLGAVSALVSDVRARGVGHCGRPLSVRLDVVHRDRQAIIAIARTASTVA
jgi:hypothetical protein